MNTDVNSEVKPFDQVAGAEERIEARNQYKELFLKAREALEKNGVPTDHFFVHLTEKQYKRISKKLMPEIQLELVRSY